LDWPAPLFAIPILWINLVTDALPALALGVESPEPDVMSRPPRTPHEPVITRSQGLLVLYHGLLIAVGGAVGFYLVYRGEASNLARAQTVAFCTIACAQLLFAFGCRSERFPVFKLGLFSNPWLVGAVGASLVLQIAAVTLPFTRPVFKTAGGLTWEWILIVALTLTPVTIVEMTKLIGANQRLRHTGRSVPARDDGAAQKGAVDSTLIRSTTLGREVRPL
jgi:Ca2+-transporting ATPase